MKYARVEPADTDRVDVGTLAPWEALAVDAVGSVIDFWNFKRNHGRVWALLYLRDRALTAAELQEALGLSKGAVSMLVRELEQWGVVTRARSTSAEAQRFVAETDLMKMLGRVLSAREAGLVASVKQDLEEAESLARSELALDRAVLDRLRRMRSLATMVDRALRLFLTTARLDLAGARQLLPFVRRGTR